MEESVTGTKADKTRCEYIPIRSATASLQFADMTADELVEKCIKAAGGKDAFKAVNTMKITAKMHVQGMELPVIGYMKRPHMGRIEVVFQGMKIINAFNDTLGWTLNPMQGETEAKKMHDNA